MKKFIQQYIVQIVLAGLIVAVHAVKVELGLYSGYHVIWVINTLLFICFVLSVVFPRSRYYEVFRKLIIFGVPILVISVVLGLLMQPRFIDNLAIEDGPVEYLSAIASFMASIIWLLFAVHSLAKRRWRFFLIAFLIMGMLLLIGLEEISWGQRIVNAESSEYFTMNNMQGETNLHNLNTALSEKIFYTLGVVALVVVPFYGDKLRSVFRKLRLGWLETFLPSAWILVPFSVIIGLAGRAIIFWVSILFVTVFSFIILMFETDRFGRKRYALQAAGRAASGVLLLVTSLVFINFNYDAYGVRFWLGTEYLELFIAVGLLVYTIDFIFRNTKILGGKSI